MKPVENVTSHSVNLVWRVELHTVRIWCGEWEFTQRESCVEKGKVTQREFLCGEG